ncbi:Universal stress protein [Tenacibaculum sp. 190524A02b]|uniref:Universal stress protein n=1 Tax=Tenacibaculum vairaonense TaxID=3137860 RepID=A0ABM9PPN4_9FLAO
MKNILLPTDFSKNSWNAISYALTLFKNQKCTFYILNTYMPSIYHINYMPKGIGYPNLITSLQENSIKNLNVIKDKIAKDFSDPLHTIETISALNTLTSEIKEIIEKKHIHFIVMGTKGASDAIEVMFGTNTMTVINDIKSPTIAVPKDYEFKDFDSVLFPTDYQIAYQNHHLNPIKNLIKTYNTELHTLHVKNNTDTELTKRQIANQQKLHSFFKEHEIVPHFTDDKYIPKAVDEFLIKTKADLLVMLNNKNSFFGNLFFKPIINKIGFDLKVPFLVIPSKI